MLETTHRRVLAILAALLASCALSRPAAAQGAPDAGAGAQPAPAAAGKPLRVYTKPIEPFSMEKDGKQVGFSIDLWDRVAKEMGVTYELKVVPSVGEVVEAVKKNEADIGIAAISITSDRESAIDFSQSFYESGLSILVNSQGDGGSTAAILKSFFSLDFLLLCGVLLLLLVVTANLLWLFERSTNSEQFPAPYLKGVWESAWWAISTILSGGCDAKGPMALGGRIIGAFWMIVSIVLVSYFTASITSIMTVNQLTSEINGPADLPGRPIATVKGSTAERYLTNRKSEVKAFATIDEAYAALSSKDVKAVVYDEPILAYHAHKASGGQMRVVGRLFERQNYGIAMPKGSDQRKRINEVLLKLRETGFLDELNQKWFGSEE
ncbi:MAG: transporter substrate-binding domain-containing protein [Polyangiaceae bacterium]